jgi:hypothetical protein
MTYLGVISETSNPATPFLVTVTDESGQVFCAFRARTRGEADSRLVELLKTLREGQED